MKKCARGPMRSRSPFRRKCQQRRIVASREPGQVSQRHSCRIGPLPLCFRIGAHSCRTSHPSGSRRTERPWLSPQTRIGAVVASMWPMAAAQISWIVLAHVQPLMAHSTGGPASNASSGGARPFRSAGCCPTPVPACAPPENYYPNARLTSNAPPSRSRK
jgi:hypothetical protein